MQFQKLFSLILRDTVRTVGALTLIYWLVSLFTAEFSFSEDSLWQIVLLGLSLASFKLAFLKSPSLSEKSQQLSYYLYSSLGGLSLLAVLFYFTPGGRTASWHLIVAILVPVFAVKAIANSMMFFDAKKDATEVNEQIKSRSQGKSA